MTEAKYEELKKLFGKAYADLVRRLVRFGDRRDLREYLKLRKHAIRAGGGVVRTRICTGLNDSHCELHLNKKKADGNLTVAK